jgi:hypothetical protein
MYDAWDPETETEGQMPEESGRWLSVDEHVKELAEESWSTYWREMGQEEALEFFKNPARRLVDDGLIEEDYHVEFREVNANQSFEAEGPRCALVMVFPREKVALITSYRHPS